MKKTVIARYQKTLADGQPTLRTVAFSSCHRDHDGLPSSVHNLVGFNDSSPTRWPLRLLPLLPFPQVAWLSDSIRALCSLRLQLVQRLLAWSTPLLLPAAHVLTSAFLAPQLLLSLLLSLELSHCDLAVLVTDCGAPAGLSRAHHQSHGVDGVRRCVASCVVHVWLGWGCCGMQRSVHQNTPHSPMSHLKQWQHKKAFWGLAIKFFRKKGSRGCLEAHRTCEGDGDVVGVLTPLRGGAQVVLHGVQVLELSVLLGGASGRRSGRRRGRSGRSRKGGR